MKQSFPVPTMHRMLALATFLVSNEHHELGLRIAEDVLNTSTATLNSIRRELRVFVFSREPLGSNAAVMNLLRYLETKEYRSVMKMSGGVLGSLFNGENEWIKLESGEWLRCFLVDTLTNAVADVAQIVNSYETTLVLSHEHESDRKKLQEALANAQIPTDWITIESIAERVPYAPDDARCLTFVEMVVPSKFTGSGNDYHAAADRVDDFIRRAKQNGVENAGKQVQWELKKAAQEEQ